MDDVAASRFRDVLDLQCGTVSRRQALEAGLTDNDLRRMVRRKELARVHEGVYVDHTGPLSWRQRAWAGVLFCEPSALWLAAARRAADGPGRTSYDDGQPIDVAVDRSRNLVEPDGVRLHRVSHLDGAVLWNASPPRQRIEHAVVGLAARAHRDIDAVAHLADAVGARQTTAARLRAALDDHERIARRRFLESVIDDIGSGTCSTLEHGYLTLVERPHGLPTAQRQFRESINGPLFRDAAYLRFGGIVELDGRLFHSSVAARDRDLERDLDVALTDRVTVRLGWGQVFDRPCATAVKVGSWLTKRGWTGQVRACPACRTEARRLCG